MIKINRKSQGLPINVMIIAALGLAVLFVLIIIFTNQTGRNVSALENCAGRGGQCRENACLEAEIQTSTGKCSKTKELCCIKFYEDTK